MLWGRTIGYEPQQKLLEGGCSRGCRVLWGGIPPAALGRAPASAAERGAAPHAGSVLDEALPPSPGARVLPWW